MSGSKHFFNIIFLALAAVWYGRLVFVVDVAKLQSSLKIDILNLVIYFKSNFSIPHKQTKVAVVTMSVKVCEGTKKTGRRACVFGVCPSN